MKNLKDLKTWADVKIHQRIGEILLSAGKINLIQLGMALDIQHFKAMPLGEIFVEMDVIDDDTLKSALEVQKSIDESAEDSAEDKADESTDNRGENEL